MALSAVIVSQSVNSISRDVLSPTSRRDSLDEVKALDWKQDIVVLHRLLRIVSGR